MDFANSRGKGTAMESIELCSSGCNDKRKVLASRSKEPHMIYIAYILSV